MTAADDTQKRKEMIEMEAEHVDKNEAHWMIVGDAARPGESLPSLQSLAAKYLSKRHSIPSITMTPSDKKRSRRLRKKLHVGEFKELGFEFAVELAFGLSTEDEKFFVDCLLTEVAGPRSLAFAGWVTGGFITCLGCGSTTEDDRKAIETWLLTRSEVKSTEVGPLRDAWYEGNGSSTAIRYCNGIGSCGHITPAGRNIFLDLGFEPSEAARLLIEADKRITEKLKRNENIALVQREAEHVFG